MSRARMMPRGATVLNEDGGRDFRDVQSLREGDTVFVAVGERIPADGTVLKGEGMLDLSIVTGETSPESIEPGCPPPCDAFLADARARQREQSLRPWRESVESWRQYVAQAAYGKHDMLFSTLRNMEGPGRTPFAVDSYDIEEVLFGIFDSALRGSLATV